MINRLSFFCIIIEYGTVIVGLEDEHRRSEFH